MSKYTAMLKKRKADVHKAKPARYIPKQEQTSGCLTCPSFSICQEMTRTSGIMPCQPQDQDADCFINRRFAGDFDQLLADRAPGEYHRPPKKQIITGA